MADRLHRNKSGFTLMEFIVAMAMVAIILPAITLSFRTALDAGGRVDRRSETTAEARGILAVIEQDLRNAYLPVPQGTSTSATSATQTSGTGQPAGWLIGTQSASGSSPADSLSLTTLSGRPPISTMVQGLTPADTEQPMSRFIQVNYSLQQGLNGTGVLLRDYASPPGIDSTATTDEEILSDHVGGLKFEYFDGATWQTSWDTTNPQTTNVSTDPLNTTTPPPPLPTAIRVTLSIITNEGRQTYTTTVDLPMYNSSTSKIEVDDTPAGGAPAATGATAGAAGGATGGTTGGTTGGAGKPSTTP